MSKKLIITVSAIVLVLALTGGALAATPYVRQGENVRFGRMMGGLVTRIADFLGIDVAIVQADRASGMTFADILGDRLDEFVQATVEDRQAMIEQLVLAGKITAEQAALCASFSTERLQERLQADFRGCGDREFANPARRLMQNMRGRMQRIRQKNIAPVLNGGA